MVPNQNPSGAKLASLTVLEWNTNSIPLTYVGKGSSMTGAELKAARKAKGLN